MQTEKKQLLIYVIVAYGITCVQGLLMCGAKHGKDASQCFQRRRCCISSRCDMMAYLITKKEDKSKDLCAYGGAGCLHGGFCSGSEKYRSDGYDVFSVGADFGVHYDRWQCYFLASSSGIR